MLMKFSLLGANLCWKGKARIRHLKGTGGSSKGGAVAEALCVARVRTRTEARRLNEVPSMSPESGVVARGSLRRVGEDVDEAPIQIRIDGHLGGSKRESRRWRWARGSLRCVGEDADEAAIQIRNDGDQKGGQA